MSSDEQTGCRNETEQMVSLWWHHTLKQQEGNEGEQD